MNFIKKHPIFSVLCLVSGLAFIAGLVLSFMAAGDLSKAKAELKREKAQFQAAQSASPSPVKANVEALDANLASLEEAFQSAVSRLESRRPFELADDSDVLLPEILKYVRDFQARAKASDFINIKEGEAFGFSTYTTGVKPPPQELVPMIDKQKEILTYIVQRLFDAANESQEPLSVLAVEREYLEAPQNSKTSSNNRRRTAKSGGAFVIDDAVTARVDGAIETLAFKIEFSGYTEPLRLFIESMSEFDLPVVVRSVEVNRKAIARASAATRSAPRQSQPSGLESLFGSGASEPEESDAPAEIDDTPIVDQNESVFTIILEYVEVSIENEEGEA